MKLALLDRESILNRNQQDFITSRQELTLLPGVAPAITLLNEASIPIVLITSPIVEHEEISLESWKESQLYLQDLLKQRGAVVDKIYESTGKHQPYSHSAPNPSLLLEALKDFEVKPQDAILIGDALGALQAASLIKCPRILLRTGKGLQTLQNGLPDAVLPVTMFNDLYEAITHLLEEGIC